MSRTKVLSLTAVALGLSLAASNSQAQYSNGGNAASSGLVNSTVEAGPSSFSSNAWHAGPSASNAKVYFPTTTLDVMPLSGMDVTGPLPGRPGNSRQPAFESQAYGSHPDKWPYSTARVSTYGTMGPTVTPIQVPVTNAPYRFAGKLWARFDAASGKSPGWYVCTASLIKKGLLITAAHCIHNYGMGLNGFAEEVRWYPAVWTSAGVQGPWGYYPARTWRIPNVYISGNDTCQTGAIGIVCNNDIATVTIFPKGGLFAGETLGGWYGYAWNTYGFQPSPAFGNLRVGSLTQLGYPVALDSGYQMIRNHSLGKLVMTTGADSHALINIQMGSAQTGGSSGGPWLLNFGARPIVTGSASLGSFSTTNLVTAVTSWGYTAVGTNVQGASYFGQNFFFPNANYGGYGAGNIGKIVQDSCISNPTYC